MFCHIRNYVIKVAKYMHRNLSLFLQRRGELPQVILESTDINRVEPIVKEEPIKKIKKVSKVYKKLESEA